MVKKIWKNDNVLKGEKIDIQKDSENEYFYADAQLLFAEEEYLEAELIKEKDLYGIRFSDVAKQFMTVTEDEQLETVAQNIGVELYQLQNIMDKYKLNDGEFTFDIKLVPFVKA